jgi:hypothetical protein
MPYLTDQRKHDIDTNPKQPLVTAGDLTYKLTMIALECDDSNQFSDMVLDAIARYMPQQPRYENYAVVLGCLDSTRREIRRRENSLTVYLKNRINHSWYMLTLFSESYYKNVVAPYEDEKIAQNGDVF